MTKNQEDRFSVLTVQKKVVWDGISVALYHARRGEVPEHQHPQHQIILPLNGCFEGDLHTASGRRARGIVSAGNACILPAHSKHSARFNVEMEYLSVYLDPALISRASGSSFNGQVEIAEKCVDSDPVINHVAMALRSELEFEGLNGRLYAESLGNVLAVHLLRHYGASGQALPQFSGGLTGFKLRRATDFIAENFERSISLAEIASQVGMSPFHFAREFKKATGIAPHQYLIHQRVERAKALLVESELPIVEVSLRTGFTNQSHFTRFFRKLTSITPRAFREAAR